MAQLVLRKQVCSSLKIKAVLHSQIFYTIIGLAISKEILYWRNNINSELPCWAYLEQSSARLSLNSVISSQLPLPANFSLNLVVSHSVKIWTQWRKHTGLHRSSILSPIFKNHCFVPFIMDEAFQIWFNKGIKTIDDLYESGIFHSLIIFLRDSIYLTPTYFVSFKSGTLCKNYSHFPNRPPKNLHWMNS